jgi:multidrug efflux pump subunit AcrA (membrane-fusion protein)
MNKRTFSILVVMMAATVLLAGCGSTKGPGATPAATVSGVTPHTVQFQTLPETYDAVGTIRSAITSTLGAELSGTVLEIRVKVGDHVKRGEVLAILDDRSPRAQLAAAEAGVAESKEGLAEADQALQAAAAERKLAELTYHRYQDLLAKTSATQQELDNAEARYKSAAANEAALEARKRQMAARSQQAQSQQDSAQTLVSYSRIVSPIDGVVTAKSVDAGTLVMSGTPIFTVEDAAHYRLEASVPEELLPKVRESQQVPVWTERGRFTAKIVEIVPVADPGSRTFLVKLALPATSSCRSGEYGKAAFSLGERKALAVPRSAIVERGQLEGVYVVDSHDIAEYRLVKTGKSLGDQVEILSGVSAGERVATSLLDRLSDGVHVEAP